MKVRKAVIPAAGLGTRMLPATKTVPKEMLPMVDKPVIQYIIEEAVAAGIEDILIVTNRAKSAMDDYFDYYPELETRLLQSGKESELVEVRRAADLANIFYVRQKETKGLGHAIGRARRFVGDEPFAVLLGDDIMRAKKPVTLQLVEAAEKYGASALGVQEVATEAISRYSSVKVAPLEERIFDVSDMNEKPTPEQRFSNTPFWAATCSLRRSSIFWRTSSLVTAGRFSSPTACGSCAGEAAWWPWTLRAAGMTLATSAASWRPPSTSPWITRPPVRGSRAS